MGGVEEKKIGGRVEKLREAYNPLRVGSQVVRAEPTARAICRAFNEHLREMRKAAAGPKNDRATTQRANLAPKATPRSRGEFPASSELRAVHAPHESAFVRGHKEPQRVPVGYEACKAGIPISG